MSCFTLYKRAVLIEEPNRGAELDAYGESVLDAARSYRWELVRNYEKVPGSSGGDTFRFWAYLDTSLFTKEVTCPHAAYMAANARPAAGLDRQPARKMSKPGSANMEPRGRGGEVEARWRRMSAEGSTGRTASVPLETGVSTGTSAQGAGANTRWAGAAVNGRSGV